MGGLETARAKATDPTRRSPSGTPVIVLRYIDSIVVFDTSMSAIVPTVLETAILGLLVEHDLHGYELKKRLARLLGPWSSVSFGSLYPALNRLERAALVDSVEPVAGGTTVSASLGADLAAFRSRGRQAATGRRGRKVYALTDAGRQRLTDLLQDPDGDDRSFAVRVAFCGQLQPGERLRLFQRRDAELARREAAQPDEDASALGDRYRRSFHDFHHDRLSRERAWLADLLHTESTLVDDHGSDDPSTHPSGGTEI